MRRKEREITNQNELFDIMRKCDVCRLAFCDNNIPYMVPMNFGAEFINGQFILYFHSAKQGKKLTIIADNPNVCFEMDCNHKLIQDDTACNCTMKYESIIGNGKIESISEPSEKIHALNCIMQQYSGKNEYAYTDEAVNAVCVLKLNVDSISGKRNP